MNERSLTTKELIASTALRLFVEKGITETRIRDIAAAAQIAEGTLYRHYKSKEELAWDLFITNLQIFTQALDEVQKKEETLREKLDAMIRYFCRKFDEDWVMFSYLLLSQHGHAKRIPPEMKVPVGVLREVIGQGMEKGEIPRKDTYVASSMVIGLVLQIAVIKVYGRIEYSLTTLADTLSEAGWRVLEG